MRRRRFDFGFAAFVLAALCGLTLAAAAVTCTDRAIAEGRR